MESDTEIWLKKYGEDFLRDIGIHEGQTVLDFGCGSGYYTIPAAKIVGSNGKVYALDKDGEKLKEVIKMATSENLSNIEIIKTSGEAKIPLEDRCTDVVLLYDIIHSYHFSSTARKELLREIYRISKSNALISVYPRHMDLKEAYNELVRANFLFEKKLFKKVLHNRTLVEDYILNFRKK